MRHRSIWIGIALLLLSAPVGADDYTESIPAEPGGTLFVELGGGSVEIETHGRDEVRAYARARGLGSRGVGFQLRADGPDVHFRAESGGWLSDLAGIRARVRLRVPHRFSVDVRTNGGDIEIEELQGSVTARTSGGSINLQGAQGSVDLYSSGGPVEAEEIQGDVRVRTSGGSIELSEVSGTVDVETSGGGLELLDVGGPVRAVTSGGPIEVRFRDAAEGELETSGGNIEIELPSRGGVEIDAKTSGGRVELDRDVEFRGERGRSHLVGALNGGGARLRVRTSGGNIEIAVD